MSIGVLQVIENSLLTTPTLTFTFPSLTAGSSIGVYGSCEGSETMTCADTLNGSYGAAVDDILDVPDGQRVTSFKFQNSAGSATPVVVTLTFSAATNFTGGFATEVGGAATASYDGHNGQVQATPTTSTDAVTSGTATPTAQPGLILSCSSNTSGAAAPSAGTGFTDHGTGWVNAGPARLESKRYTATSAIAGTFTAGSNSAHTTLSLFFKETGAGAATVGPGASRSAGPGIGPDKRVVFTQRPLSQQIAGANVTVGLTGQAATFSSGTISPALSVALTGAAATFAQGTLIASLDKVGRPLVTGPGISPDYTKLFLGRRLSTTVNASSDVTVALAGQGATFAAGTLNPSASVPLAGQSATFGVGTMSTGNDVTVGLIGQSAAFTAGTLTPSSAVALTGNSATFTPGTLVATPTVAFTGQAATMAAGTLTPNFALALSGLQATFSPGTLGAQASGDVTVALTGLATTFSAGRLSPSGGDSTTAGGGKSQKKARKPKASSLIVDEFANPVFKRPIPIPTAPKFTVTFADLIREQESLSSEIYNPLSVNYHELAAMMLLMMME